MTLVSFMIFAGAILVLFFTPGPGNVAMVARTLDAGPAHGFVYGGGIITGDIFWLTVAIAGLSAVIDQVGTASLVIKVVGVSILLWFAWGSFRSFLSPKTAAISKPSRLGLAGTYLAGIAMPLTNPKPIVFYLSILPALFDLSQVNPVSYGIMVAIMLGMYFLTAAVHVGLADRARGWLQARGFKRWADAVTALIMVSVAILLILR